MSKKKELRFIVKPNFGHWAVIDLPNKLMVVGYSNKKYAELTAEGLNNIQDPAELSEMLLTLKTPDGYGYFVLNK